MLTSSWHLNQVPVAAPWLVRAPIQKARPMIEALAQSGKNSATSEFFDVHSHCSVLK